MLKLPVTQFAVGKIPPEHSGIKFASRHYMTEFLNYEAYNRFIIRSLVNCFDTSHVLVCQPDGFPINLGAWEDEFLQWDYIGAVWPDGVVGNGGFSLRSKKFCEATAQLTFPEYAPEDVRLCRDARQVLEDAFGIRFAPAHVAKRFSFELTPAFEGVPAHGEYTGQFGFHGKESMQLLKELGVL